MTRGQGAVAAIALAAAAACLYGIFAAGARIYESIGPSKAVAMPDGRLYLVSHGKIHIFAEDGKRRDTHAIGSRGACGRARRRGEPRWLGPAPLQAAGGTL